MTTVHKVPNEAAPWDRKSAWYRFGPQMAGMAIILAVLAIWYALPEQRFVQVHDYLDSNLPRLKVLTEHHLMFAPLGSRVMPLMDGVQRDALQSQFKLLVPAFMLLSPVSAFLANELLSRLLAFFGFMLFFRAHFRDGVNPWIASGVSVLYALLPVYPGDPYTQPAVPWGAWAVMNIATHQRPLPSLGVLALLPLAGSFGIAGPAYGLLAMFPLLHAAFHRCRPHGAAFAAPIVVVLSFILTDYRIFHLQLMARDFVSHRESFVFEQLSTRESIAEFVGNFLHGQYHLPSLHAPIILLAAFGGIVGAWKHGAERRLRPFILLLLLCASLSAIHASHQFVRAHPALMNAVGLGTITTLNLGRVIALSAFLWYLLFAHALREFLEARGPRLGRIVVLLFLLLQFSVLWKGSHWQTVRERYGMTITEFLSEDLFLEIRNHIGADPSTYRILSVGMLPSIPLYNGFYCLDGYLGAYPLEYKRSFREIIAPELEKDAVIRDYFDNWGSRAYAFSSELGRDFLFPRWKERELKNWSMDVEAFQRMGGRYVLSAVPIVTGPWNGLELDRVFEHPHSPWVVRLYRIAPGSKPQSPPHSGLPDNPGSSPGLVESQTVDIGP